MADLSALQAGIDALEAQVAKTVGIEESAAALITGFSQAVQKAVADALAADNAADDASITAASAAIADVTSRFLASQEKLGAAVAANQPPA